MRHGEVLTRSHATRQRHLWKAKLFQAEIAERWKRERPWTWQRKHVTWFLENRLGRRSEATRYYYVLTVRLIARRLEKSWPNVLRSGCMKEVIARQDAYSI
ncbi:hypothetical protein [Pseudomonas chlororaphis]